MIAFGVAGLIVFVVLGVLLWRQVTVVKAEVETTVRNIENAFLAVAGITREVERAEVHLQRLAKLRVRRLIVSRIFSRRGQRLLGRPRT